MVAEETFSMFSSPKDRALQAGLKLVSPPNEPQQLFEKYRPNVLADLVGQEKVVKQLSAFVKAPYATVLLFKGDTGTGKTSGKSKAPNPPPAATGEGETEKQRADTGTES